MEAKANLRRAIKERLQRMSDNDRRVESQIIVRELKKLVGTEPAIIGGYLPFVDEPDIKPLMNDLLQAGWTLAIPSMEGGGMVFRAVQSLEGIAKDPVTGIPTPPPGSDLIQSVDIIIVPGRAFTPQCQRLGRGSGGYDKWLSDYVPAHPTLRTIGVCFDCQIVQEMPVETHDRPVDTVLTATRRFHRTKN